MIDRMNLTAAPHRRWSKPLEHLVFAWLPLLLTLRVAQISWGHSLGVDFRMQYWLAGWNVLHGLSPYGSAPLQLGAAEAFPYPAFTAIAFVPLALIPAGASAGLFVAACIAAPLASL